MAAHDDAISSVEMVLDGDEEGAIRLMIGNSFLDADEDGATEFIEAQRSKKAAELEELEARVAAIKAEQAALKVSLYDRFGKTINLEDGE